MVWHFWKPQSPSDSVHSELYTFVSNFNSCSKRLCEGIGQTLIKDDSWGSTLAISDNLDDELEPVGLEESPPLQLVVVGMPEVPARVLQHPEPVPVRPKQELQVITIASGHNKNFRS